MRSTQRQTTSRKCASVYPFGGAGAELGHSDYYFFFIMRRAALGGPLRTKTVRLAISNKEQPAEREQDGAAGSPGVRRGIAFQERSFEPTPFLVRVQGV